MKRQLALVTQILIFTVAMGMVIARGQILVENDPLSAVDHNFGSLGDFGSPDQAFQTIDQFATGDSVPGANLNFNNMTMSLHDNGAGTLTLTLSAPSGQAFQINPQGNSSSFEVLVSYGSAPSRSASAITLTGTSLSFTGLTGAFGTQTDGSFITNDGKTELFDLILAVPEAVSFTSLTYTLDYNPSDVAEAGSLAFAGGNINFTEDYPLADSTDPGARLTLVPAAAPEPATSIALVLGLVGLIAFTHLTRRTKIERV